VLLQDGEDLLPVKRVRRVVEVRDRLYHVEGDDLAEDPHMTRPHEVQYTAVDLVQGPIARVPRTSRAVEALLLQVLLNERLVETDAPVRQSGGAPRGIAVRGAPRGIAVPSARARPQ